MAVTKETKILGINDLKICPIKSDNDFEFVVSSTNYAANAIDMKGIQTLALTPAFIEKDLRGDEVVLDRYTKLDNIGWSFTNAIMSLDALQLLLGGTIKNLPANGAGAITEFTIFANSYGTVTGTFDIQNVGGIVTPSGPSNSIVGIPVDDTKTLAQNTTAITAYLNSLSYVTSVYKITNPNGNIKFTAKTDFATPSTPPTISTPPTGSSINIINYVQGVASSTSESNVYTLSGLDLPKYFVLQAQTKYTDAGDVQVRLYKCKASKVDYELKGEDYAVVSVSGIAIPTQFQFNGTSGKVKDVIINEVATPISFNDLI